MRNEYRLAKRFCWSVITFGGLLLVFNNSIPRVASFAPLPSPPPTTAAGAAAKSGSRTFLRLPFAVIQQVTRTSTSFLKSGNGNNKDEGIEDDFADDDLMEDPVLLPVGMEDTLSEEDLEGLTITQLKQQLRLRGLKVGGRKRELIDRLLTSPYLGDDEDGSNDNDDDIAEKNKKSKARQFAESQGKELVDVSDFLEDEDKGKDVKSWGGVVDAEFEKEEQNDQKEDSKKSSGSDSDDNNGNKAEVWGSEARIVDDYEGRRLVVDTLSQLVVEFKGSNQSYVSALVVASRDALKPFLMGGENKKNQTSAELRLREIQTKREQANRSPVKLDEFEGADGGDDKNLYANVIERDYSDWGKYTVTGAQLSAAEVQGVLLLSDVYGAFSPDTQALAEKIAFECQPVVVMVPDLFRGHPWKEEKSTPGKNKQGQTYEQWRATHSDLRVSVDIRAAAACLRERYGVSSVVVWGTCYGGGRALEAAAGYLPDGNIHDVDGSVGPGLALPSVVVAWYPTRYNARALFGRDRIVGIQGTEETSKFAVMGVFAGKDVLPGATTNDAAKLKDLLGEDPRVKDILIKVFNDLDHGFAHIGLAEKSNGGADTEFEQFVDDEFGGSGRVSLDDGEADVACLLSTAFMETYSRVFLPTIGAPIRDEDNEEWSSDLEMKDISEKNTRDIRKEIEDSIDNYVDEPMSGLSIDPTNEEERKELEAWIQSEQSSRDNEIF